MDAGAARGAERIVGRPRLEMVRAADVAGLADCRTEGPADCIAPLDKAVRAAVELDVGSVQ